MLNILAARSAITPYSHHINFSIYLGLILGISIISPAISATKNNINPKRLKLSTREFVVEIQATTETNPPCIKLNWAPRPALSYAIFRREFGARTWSTNSLEKLNGDAVAYSDHDVQQAVCYEYRVDRISDGYVGRGYICSGINLPLRGERGDILLVIEREMATIMKPRIERLVLDMVGDGWQVRQQIVNRTSKPTEVKQIILDEYKQNPRLLKQVFLLGNIPVPYSGDIYPDGHTNHRGAWPADVYYGDMDESLWTDSIDYRTVLLNNPLYANIHARLNNIIGDGKFDRSLVKAGSIELAIGRVDLSNMPIFPLGEVNLLRRYLDKNHAYRHRLITFKNQALIDDNFHFFKGEAFAASGWMGFTPLVGVTNVYEKDWFTDGKNESYLLGYGCGGGSKDKAGGVGTSLDFASGNAQIAFTLLFGSWFGDWDLVNNFMRAPLAAPSGLSCVWAGRPHWFFHSMAVGESLGDIFLQTINNNYNVDYIRSTPNVPQQDPVPPDDDPEMNVNNSVHTALMGDPSLRLATVQSVTGLSARPKNKSTLITSWKTDDTGAIGYLIYKSKNITGPYTKLTPTPIAASAYMDKNWNSEESFYMVKAALLYHSASGTFIETSQGSILKVSDAGKPNQAPIAKGYSIVSNEDIPITFNLEVSDFDGDTIFTAIAHQPLHGNLVPGKKKAMWIYRPNANWYGTDSFTFTAFDGIVDSLPATVNIEIVSVEDLPTATPINLALHNDSPRKITLSGSDPEGDKLTFRILSEPKHGKLSGKIPVLTYTPNSSHNTKEVFTYCANDGKQDSPAAKITINSSHPCTKTVTPIQIDGKLDDWTTLPYICRDPEAFACERQSWRGPDDCSFRFGVAYDTTNLYLAIIVTDNEIQSKVGIDPWAQDGIEIRLDARPEPVRSINKGKGEMTDFLLIGLSPNYDADKPWIHKPEKLPRGYQAICLLQPTGYITEIALPLEYLNKQSGGTWDGFRLSIGVDDHDKDGFVQIWWRPDWRSSSAYEGSGSFLKK